MIQIDNAEIYGWEAAILGMRNSWNSWEKSDSEFYIETTYFSDVSCNSKLHFIGENDLALMKKLVKAGSDHRKFMRFITVTCDITAPLYWWKEFDTYKVGTVRNSCSTMHTITREEFSIDDFSRDYLTDFDDVRGGYTTTCGVLSYIVTVLNELRIKFLLCKDDDQKKRYWWQIIQLLPSSYNQKATVQMNYEVLRAMYHARKNHKLDEWRDFCKWIEGLSCSELITEKEGTQDA